MIENTLYLMAGAAIGVVLTFPKIRQAQKSAATDTLTGLYNRSVLDKTLGRLYAAAVREKKSMAILMIDLNHFKEANDRFGHHFGDLVLKEAAVAMVASLRDSDFIFRYGGDEFMLILPNTSIEGALRVSKKIKLKLDSVSLTTPKDTVFQDLEASIGIACYPEIKGDEQTLVKAADQAVFLAKDRKGHVEVAKHES